MTVTYNFTEKLKLKTELSSKQTIHVYRIPLLIRIQKMCTLTYMTVTYNFTEKLKLKTELSSKDYIQDSSLDKDSENVYFDLKMTVTYNFTEKLKLKTELSSKQTTYRIPL